MSRNTVNKLLALKEAPPPNQHLGTRSLLDPYKDTIWTLLEIDPKMPATVMRRRLLELGYKGGISTLKNYLATVRPQFLAPPVPTFAPYRVATSPVWSAPVPLEAEINAHSGSFDPSASEIDLSGLVPQTGSDTAMILISADFEIVAVNPALERLRKKPRAALLGKKCYWEFEGRTTVCPDCPGAAALATGKPHAADATGIGRDGLQHMARLTTYPISGPTGQLVGFVEVEEDITEQRRSEKLVELIDSLETSLATVDGTGGLLRHALNSALSLDGVDFGCAYVRQEKGEYRAIAQRGISRDLAETLARQIPEPVSGTISCGSSSVSELGGDRRPAAVALIPIVREGISAARLLVGSTTYAQFSSATLAALDALGKMVSAVAASLAAKHMQKEIASSLRALLHFLPLPVWCIDDAHRVTLWNRAAEQALGWKEREILQAHPASPDTEADTPLESFLRLATTARDEDGSQFQCIGKHGRHLRVTASAMSLPQVIGQQSYKLSHVIVATVSDARPALFLADTDSPTPASSSSSDRTLAPRSPSAALPPRVLVVDPDEEQRHVLVEVLSKLGSSVTACASTSIAIALFGDVAASKHRFDVVICELLPSDGCDGLDLAVSLLKIDPHAKVILSADSPITGLESHGFAGALTKPFTKELARGLLSDILTT